MSFETIETLYPTCPYCGQGGYEGEFETTQDWQEEFEVEGEFAYFKCLRCDKEFRIERCTKYDSYKLEE